MNINRKFGVTFHDNMDLATLISQWNKVAPAIRAANPTIEAAMTAAQVANGAQSATIAVQSVAVSTFQTIKDAVEAGAAVLTGNLGYAGTKVAAEAAKVSQEAATGVIQTQKTSLLQLLNNS